jgi:acyl-coenzyme A thioesterase PaaI-like protein
MEIRTHNKVSEKLVGKPVLLETNQSIVELKSCDEMVVDETGLIHGGFSFGLADYAAMLAVNHPYVVLGSATTRFTAPVKIGEPMIASAKVAEEDGKKRIVNVEVKVKEKLVLKADLTCFVLDNHVLN